MSVEKSIISTLLTKRNQKQYKNQDLKCKLYMIMDIILEIILHKISKILKIVKI